MRFFVISIYTASASEQSKDEQNVKKKKTVYRSISCSILRFFCFIRTFASFFPCPGNKLTGNARTFSRFFLPTWLRLLLKFPCYVWPLFSGPICIFSNQFDAGEAFFFSFDILLDNFCLCFCTLRAALVINWWSSYAAEHCTAWSGNCIE